MRSTQHLLACKNDMRFALSLFKFQNCQCTMNFCTLSRALIGCPQCWFDMVFETLVLYGLQVQYFRYRYSNMTSYDNSIFNISASIFSILGAIFGEIIIQNLANSEKCSIQVFDISIDIVLEFCYDITIWEMTSFDKVDYIEIEPALGCCELYRLQLS